MDHAQLLCTMLALLVIVPAVRMAGGVSDQWHQPRVIGEIVCGLALGVVAMQAEPAWFGLAAFPKVAPVLGLIANLGIVFMLFQLGMDFDFAHLQHTRHRRAVLGSATGGLVLPFAGGVAMFVLESKFGEGPWSLRAAVFCGIAFAVSALPVLARVLVESGLARTPIGAVAIASAGIQDLVCWLAIAALAAMQVAHAQASTGMGPTLAGMAAFLAVVFFVVRPLSRRVVRPAPASSDGAPSHDRLAWMLVAVLAASASTVLLGLHGAIGAFTLGVALYDRHELRDAWSRDATPLVYTLLVPVFFVLTGARLHVDGMALSHLAWGGAWLVAACATKVGGAFLGARLAGVGRLDGLRLGVLLNTRGLTELVMLNMGLDLGLISPSLFTVLVAMAIASTVATVPLMRWLQSTGRGHAAAAGSMGLMK